MTPRDAWKLGVQQAMGVTALHFTASKPMSQETVLVLVELQRKLTDRYNTQSPGDSQGET